MTDRPLTDRDFQALARFRSGLRHFLAFSEEAAIAEGVTPQQHQLLLAVRGYAGEGCPSVTDLAELLGRRRNSTVELIDRAEAHRLVTTHNDPADRRRRLVRLTPEGRQLIERLAEIHRSELQRFRADMAEALDELT